MTKYIAKYDRDFHGEYFGRIKTVPTRRGLSGQGTFEVCLRRNNMILKGATKELIDAGVNLMIEMENENKRPQPTIQTTSNDDFQFGHGISPVQSAGALDQMPDHITPSSFESSASTTSKSLSRQVVDVQGVGRRIEFQDGSLEDSPIASDDQACAIEVDDGCGTCDEGGENDDPLTTAQDGHSDSDGDDDVPVPDKYHHPLAAPFVSRIKNLDFNDGAAPVEDPPFYKADPRIKDPRIPKMKTPLELFLATNLKKFVCTQISTNHNKGPNGREIFQSTIF